MTTDKDFSGKTVLVTGAAGPGLGQACARLFASAGATVWVSDRSERRVQQTVEAIVSDHPDASVLPLTMDVSDPHSIEDAVQRAGAIDVLVNNAAIAEKSPIVETSLDSWDRVMAVNLRGPFLLMRAVLPGMCERRSGAIVNIASVDAWTGNEEHISSYVASKAGLLGLTRVAAAESGPRGVRVNAVAPGLMENKAIQELNGTDRLSFVKSNTALRRGGHPTEVAQAVFFLASDRASFITGETIDVSGGYYFHA